MYEYAIIYKQTFGGAKYSMITVEEDNLNDAKDYALSSYGYLFNNDETNIVKVVKLGKAD